MSLSHPDDTTSKEPACWFSAQFNKLLGALLLCAVLYAAIGFAIDLRHTAAYGGVDLRHRVVGARVMLHHRDPYFFKWHSDLPEEWLDLTDRDVPISQVTVPPAVLSLHSVIAPLPYRTQRLIWFFVQWALLLGTIVLAAGCASTALQKKMIWTVALLAISGSFFWRLHVERGQIYVLYAFLIMLSYWFARRHSVSNHLIAGIVLGISISLRPVLVVMSIPLLISRRWTILGGASIGALIGLAASASITGFHLWQSYFSAMAISEQIYLGTYHSASSTGPGTLPSVIEGMMNLKSMLAVPTIDSSLTEIARRVGTQVTPMMLSSAYVFCVAWLMGILYGWKHIERSAASAYIVGTYIALLAEFFLPAARYSYSDIIWLPLISMIFVQQGLLNTVRSRAVIVLLIGLTCAAASPMLSYASYTVFLSEIAIVCYGLITVMRLPASSDEKARRQRISALLFSRTENLAVQATRYMAVGAVATLADMGGLYALTGILGVRYLVSAALAFLLGLAVSYTLSVRWVFASRTLKNKMMEFIVFAAIGVIGLSLTELILYAGVEWLGLHYMAGKTAAVAIVFVWNFGARRVVLFRSKPKPVLHQEPIQGGHRE